VDARVNGAAPLDQKFDFDLPKASHRAGLVLSGHRVSCAVAHHINSTETSMSITSRHVLRGDQCQCPSCGLLFTSTSSFDKHRTGSYGSGRRCRTTDELHVIGFEPNSRGYWRKALTEEQRSKLFTLRSTTTKELNHAPC
jgi:hypothetical protein